MNSFDERTHTYTIDGVEVPSVTQICSILTADKYSGNQAIIDAARARGTAVHELCEAYDYGTPEEVPTELAGYVKAWMDFCRDYRPEWLYIEHQMYSKDFEFAGTCDRIGIIDGKKAIVDIKTTASMDRASKVSLAAQLYGYNVLHNYGAETGIGVQLKKDGSYTVHDIKTIAEKLLPLTGAERIFFNCQDIYFAIHGRPEWNNK